MFFFGQENISQRRWEMCTSQIFQGSVYLVVYEHREEILPLPEKFTSALAACFTTDAALHNDSDIATFPLSFILA